MFVKIRRIRFGSLKVHLHREKANAKAILLLDGFSEKLTCSYEFR